MGKISPYVRLMRPKHYIKNVLVFLPLFFSGELLDGMLPICTMGFIAFSLLASSIYVINDLKDVEQDRAHPAKRKRPLASGAASVAGARILAPLLLMLAFVFQMLIGFLPGALILLAYFAINVAYSAGLKNIPIVDIALLSIGYLLRLLYGGAICGIEISGWLYLTVLSVSFYMGLGKRRGELLNVSADSACRKVLDSYTQGFLDKNMSMFLCLANVFYALWAREMGGLLLTVPIVMVLSLKYSLDVEGDSSGDPMEVILADRMLLICIGAYLMLLTVLLYLGC